MAMFVSAHILGGSKTSQLNQKKQHFAVKTFAPPAIKEETFLKLTVTVRRWTTSLASPFSPAWCANSNTRYPNFNILLPTNALLTYKILKFTLKHSFTVSPTGLVYTDQNM